jgi:hypothetical protein
MAAIVNKVKRYDFACSLHGQYQFERNEVQAENSIW